MLQIKSKNYSPETRSFGFLKFYENFMIFYDKVKFYAFLWFYAA